MLVCAGHAIVQHADFSECGVYFTLQFLITQRLMCQMSRAIVIGGIAARSATTWKLAAKNERSVRISLLSISNIRGRFRPPLLTITR